MTSTAPFSQRFILKRWHRVHGNFGAHSLRVLQRPCKETKARVLFHLVTTSNQFQEVSSWPPLQHVDQLYLSHKGLGIRSLLPPLHAPMIRVIIQQHATRRNPIIIDLFTRYMKEWTGLLIKQWGLTMGISIQRDGRQGGQPYISILKYTSTQAFAWYVVTWLGCVGKDDARDWSTYG